MSEPAFTALIRNRIHECAPDHSVETISVGELRRAAHDMEALYEALDDALAFIAAWAGTYQAQYGLETIHPNHQAAIDKTQAVLRQARGEQP